MAAFRKSLARRFASLLLPTAADGGVGRPCGFLFLQKRPLFQRALPPDRQLMLLAADRISERVRSLNPCRICLDVILPPARSEAPVLREEGEVLVEKKRVSLVEVRKLARASLVAVVRARLATVEKSCIAYSEFVRICCEASNSEQGLEIARSLDESGVVVVLGNVVFLRPEESKSIFGISLNSEVVFHTIDGDLIKFFPGFSCLLSSRNYNEGVAKTIEKLIPLSSSHESYHTREELKMLEEKKSEIDKQAAAQVRKELWLGLGFMVVQTAALMRVTFWELSWDVMEPICFYLTSVYFLSGYAFFLRTSKEPSFESFFASRFATKQRRLMKCDDLHKPGVICLIEAKQSSHESANDYIDINCGKLEVCSTSCTGMMPSEIMFSIAFSEVRLISALECNILVQLYLSSLMFSIAFSEARLISALECAIS
ncbi:hypothetical protein ZIOFF_043981 [Zingiber officinale]|uniref:Calcium uniporter protein C-terminal domain-containing protein n=1 Tax=Zingiber officinale TaxID=94328 RepID=A0A8J5KQY4_ZINOF|nr:hypothetical protein ZIOFF_043981 [Zingiber officinale]